MVSIETQSDVVAIWIEFHKLPMNFDGAVMATLHNYCFDNGIKGTVRSRRKSEDEPIIFEYLM